MQPGGNRIEERQDLLGGHDEDMDNRPIDNPTGNSKKKKIIIISLSILIAFGVVLAIVLPLSIHKEENNKDPINPFDYQEYNPYIWEKAEYNDWFAHGDIQIKTKLNNLFSNLQDQASEADGHRSPGKYYKPVNPKDIPDDVNNPQAHQVGYAFDLVDNYQARIRIFDKTDKQTPYQVSDDVFPRPVEAFEARLTQIGFNYSVNPFSFSLGNIYNNETIISTEKRKLVVGEKFSEIGLRLPTKRIYGLGQHNSQIQLKNGTYSLWARSFDGPLPYDNGNGGVSGSHIHPFLLCQTQNKDFFGIFFVGTAAQAFEVVYFEKYDEIVLNYITLGGEIEMYVIMRGTANEIISKYHGLIGYSKMPPYFALGLFQGASAYDSSAALNAVVKGYSDAKIPIEGLYVESYYDKAQVFGVDKIKDLKDVSTQLQQNKQRMYLAIGSGITNSPDYKYSSGEYAQYYVKSSLTKNNLIGQQSGVYTMFPDFFNPGVTSLYKDGLIDLFKAAGPADGAVFKDLQFNSKISGEYIPPKPAKRNLDEKNEEDVGLTPTYLINKTQSEKSYYYIPFIPGFDNSGYLDNLTISSNATHFGSDQTTVPKGSIEFYLHNANGHMGMKRLRDAVEREIVGQTRRSMIFSDTTWSGSGAFGGALITNLYRSWDNLKSSISMAMGLSMYGFSNIVTDVCGTIGPLNEELCGRWMQLAAFMPMARNYYTGTFKKEDKDVATEPSEFYNFKDATYKSMASKAVADKLAYSRYTYSQMYKAYREGGAIVRPLFFDFPKDDMCFDSQVTDSTYLLGDAIKVSPVLSAQEKPGGQFDSYFPAGAWADLHNYKVVVKSDKGQNQKLDVSNDYTQVHLREGKIIPYQAIDQNVKTTADLEVRPITFLVNRDGSQYADGFILVDDGLSTDSYLNEEYTYWKLRFAEKSINFWVQYGNYTYKPPTGHKTDQLQEIKILQAQDLKDINFACYLGTDIIPKPLSVNYDKDSEVLSIKPTADTISFKDLGVIKFGNKDKETNFCDPNVFSYSATVLDDQDKQISFSLINKQNKDLNEELYFVAQLMDNEGTIRVAVTTKKDHDTPYKFRPEMVTENKQYRDDTITKKLSDFLTYQLNPFFYTIHAEGDPTTVFYQSNPQKLFISDYFVLDEGKFSLNPKTGYPLMGMGERAGSIFYEPIQGGIYSRSTFDQANPIDDGLPPGRNMYGVMPMYIYQEPNENYFGVFNLNPYAQDFILYFNEGKDTTITNIMIGGIINKFFFVGKKVDDIIVKYQRLVGNPQAPPLWAFGWQQCRFGYVTDEAWYTAYKNYSTSDFPLDTMWADIDYMDDYKIFTVSKTRYPKLAEHVDELHAHNVTFVPIMDAGVAVRQKSDNYYALEKGKEMDIFIKQAESNDYLTAGVWCGNAYFPDLFTDAGVDWWKQMLDYLYVNESIKFDGIWLDENEATNFCNGYCIQEERPKNAIRNKPFWVPGWRDLEDKALGYDGRHANGWKEYDLHNMFAVTQSRATYEYLHNKTLVPYVLTRSSFPGIGKYAHHWLADNWSTDEYLKLSVDGLYSYQLFGMPFIGSDICGFNSDKTKIQDIAKVCTKWHLLGSLYPFARNHNQNATLPHEPFQFHFAYNTTAEYFDLIQLAIQVRYNYIKYYYSAFQHIEEFGGSFFKPAFFDYPTDPNAYIDVSNNIFLGKALKASILVNTTDLDPNQDHFSTFYFPQGRYCQIYPPADASNPDYCFTASDADPDSKNKTLRTKLEDYYLHLREGSILPYQEAQIHKAKNTKDIENIYTDLYILPANAYQGANATGFLYLDDGIHVTVSSNRFDFKLMITPTTIDLTIEKTKTGQRRNIDEEQIGIIKIFYASDSLGYMQDYTATAYYYEKGEEGKAPVKKSIQLDTPKYNLKSNILEIYPTYTVNTEKKRLSFFDFGLHGYIKLEAVDPQA